MILSATNITVRRGPRTVLHDVSLEARPGEVLGLLGANGAGKTTLLRLLAGLDAPEAGTVRYDGRSAAGIGRAALGRQVAYLAQNGAIHWPLKVEEVVALGRLPHRSDAATDTAAIHRAMERAEVLPFAGRTTGTLSGGERMRVLLARALAVEGRALLADEPIAALDPAHQLDVMELLRDVARGGTTVVVVLHDLTLAARFCDRLALLAAGRLHAIGAPMEVLTPGHVAAAYGVEVVAGMQEGEPFILPWRRIEDGGP
ncbi:hemin import ATP-binding protein HmuV [Azorhizobium oxalatiphilum]|uniref:Hemin import ATP-binding protein HmuV n=1 Tax=Azorhizobium oxalatiphilum TaxID=980631 RepID=A0A917C507_9HYPH|nr:ABC transporter ATP-binding protein [Azorhizobium oxalatiphilum]GGF70492.1 hemin import ATP-binding protein HmuV [Azorhizobium oxalatiphilum]